MTHNPFTQQVQTVVYIIVNGDIEASTHRHTYKYGEERAHLLVPSQSNGPGGMIDISVSIPPLVTVDVAYKGMMIYQTVQQVIRLEVPNITTSIAKCN